MPLCLLFGEGPQVGNLVRDIVDDVARGTLWTGPGGRFVAGALITVRIGQDSSTSADTHDNTLRFTGRLWLSHLARSGAEYQGYVACHPQFVVFRYLRSP